jgi:hypothetical protein
VAEQRILVGSVESDARQRSESIRCDARRPAVLPGLRRQSCWRFWRAHDDRPTG